MFSKLAFGPNSATAIERMALQDVLDDKPFGQGPKFPCRVVFRFLTGPRYVWFASCRGKKWEHPSGEGNRFFQTTQEALQWLQEGQR